MDHLVGTAMLRAYMHGFFVDNRLYDKAKLLTDPFAYETYRTERIKKKVGLWSWVTYGLYVDAGMAGHLFKIGCLTKVPENIWNASRSRTHNMQTYLVLSCNATRGLGKLPERRVERIEQARTHTRTLCARSTLHVLSHATPPQVEEERASRISMVKRLPKVNARVAAKILAEQEDGGAADGSAEGAAVTQGRKVTIACACVRVRVCIC